MSRLDDIKDLVAHHLFDCDYDKLIEEYKLTVDEAVKTRGLTSRHK